MKVLFVCDDKREWLLPRPGHPDGPRPVVSVGLSPDAGSEQGGLWEGRPAVGRWSFRRREGKMASDPIDPGRRSLAARLAEAQEEAQRAAADCRALAAALDRARHILREWAGQQGHDACWYYPEVFDRLAHLLGVDVRAPRGLPPRAEFEAGCRRFQSEQYGTPGEPTEDEVYFAALGLAVADVLRYDRNHPTGSIVPQEVMARLRAAAEEKE